MRVALCGGSPIVFSLTPEGHASSPVSFDESKSGWTGCAARVVVVVGVGVGWASQRLSFVQRRSVVVHFAMRRHVRWQRDNLLTAFF